MKLLPIVLLAACNANGGGGTLTVTWALENPDGSPAGCQPGYDKMRVTTDGFDEAGVEEAEPSSVIFDCAAGMGVIDLSGDDTKYGVTWEETDSTGGTVFLTDQISSTELLPTMADLSSGVGTASITMYPTGGWAWLEWGLFGTQAQDYLDSCAGAGVDKVALELDDGTNPPVTFMATCDAVPTSLSLDTIHGVGAITEPVLPGDYTITATAFAGGQVVGTGTADTSIDAPNRIDFTPDAVEIELTSR